MGVMSCSRRGCESIMCDTYVNSIGYVCRYCQTEFQLYLKDKGLNPNTEKQITRELDEFMDTEKDSYTDEKDDKKISVDDFFRDFEID